eukprot:g16645.t1
MGLKISPGVFQKAITTMLGDKYEDKRSSAGSMKMQCRFTRSGERWRLVWGDWGTASFVSSTTQDGRRFHRQRCRSGGSEDSLAGRLDQRFSLVPDLADPTTPETARRRTSKGQT